MSNLTRLFLEAKKKDKEPPKLKPITTKVRDIGPSMERFKKILAGWPKSSGKDKQEEGVRRVHWHGGGPGRPSDHDPGRFKEPTPEQLRKAKERAEKAGEGLVRNPDGSLVYRKLKPGEKSISGRVGKKKKG